MQISVSTDDSLLITLRDGSKAYSAKNPETTAQEQLSQLGVNTERLVLIEWDYTSTTSNYVAAIVIYVLPIVIIIGAIKWMMNRAEKRKAQV
jgi:hypothetical protein